MDVIYDIELVGHRVFANSVNLQCFLDKLRVLYLTLHCEMSNILRKTQYKTQLHDSIMFSVFIIDDI